jgi:hypothetical protein
LLRGLLLLLACLLAALPVGLCLCGHEHCQAVEHQQNEECHCHDSPRVATLPPAPDVEADSPLSLPPATADSTVAAPHVGRVAFRDESPPGYSSLPLYLSVSRLLI